MAGAQEILTLDVRKSDTMSQSLDAEPKQDEHQLLCDENGVRHLDEIKGPTKRTWIMDMARD